MMRSQATLWTVALGITCLMTTASCQLTGCVSDIVFVMDGSASVGPTNFNIMKIGVELFINTTFTNYPNTRVGFLVYGTSVTTSSNLTAQSGRTSLLNSLSGAPYPINAQGNTHLGINTAAGVLNNQGRSGSPKVMIVITDSISNNQAATITAASNARNAGVTVYAIGIEASVTGSASLLDTLGQELQQIASSPSLVTGLATFSGLPNSLGKLTNTICRVEIINSTDSQTVFTSENINLYVCLNQNGITSGVWRKSGFNLPNNGRISVTVDDKSHYLTVTKAHLIDASSYSFVIAGQTRYITVDVIAGILTWTERQTRTIGSTAPIAVNLVNGNCNLGIWTQNGTVVPIGGRISYNPTNNCVTHTLTITNLQLSDQGTYQFTYNSQQVSSVLTVSMSYAPVNGGFSAWTPWIEPPCSVTCGIAIKSVFRTRTCDNPAPMNGGADCVGLYRFSITSGCGFDSCPVNGGVAQWTTWNSASVSCPQTCGTSAQKGTTRHRTCTNPTPLNGGAFCSERLLQIRTESCGLTNACPMNGGISQWTPWVVPQCLLTCGTNVNVTATKHRFCNSPPPSNGGLNCTQSRVESQVRSCGLSPCPETPSSGWQLAVGISVGAAALLGLTVIAVCVMRRRRTSIQKVQKEKPWVPARLELIVLLGQGKFGEVWKARAAGILSEGQRDFVAVKKCKGSATEAVQADFQHEIELMKSLPKHPHVVNYLGFYTHAGSEMLILELAHMGNLLNLLRSRRPRPVSGTPPSQGAEAQELTSKQLTMFAHQVARGMRHLQYNRIIHRDLAARNVLLGDNFVCKVSDLGLARNLSGTDDDAYETKSGGPLPIRWMAPESLKDRLFSIKSDVWSFGILLWEIVTLGASPYPGQSAMEVMSFVTSGGRMPRPDHCAPELYSLMAKCWRQDQGSRPDFVDLTSELDSVLEESADYINLSDYEDDLYLIVEGQSGDLQEKI